MIKGAAGTVASPVILLGISGENFTRLLSDEPILVKLKDLHPSLPDVSIVLIGGMTDDDLVNQLQENVPGFDPISDIRH